MKALSGFKAGPAILLDIGQHILRISAAHGSASWPIERGPAGRITPECARTLQAEARNFLRRKDWQPRPKAWCAIGGRGVVLRRVTVPSISGEALQSVLALRIESEFPLPPEDLAWGFLQTSAPEGASQEVLIAAVRRQVIEEYHELLTGCGLNPQFTLASLARSHLCPSPGEPSCLLDLGGEHSELLCVDSAGPVSLRVVPWGGETITSEIAVAAGVSREEADRLKRQLDLAPVSSDLRHDETIAGVEKAVESLAAYLGPAGDVRRVYLTGRAARPPSLAVLLARRLGPDADVRSLEATTENGESSAIAGLRRAAAEGERRPLLFLQHRPAEPASIMARSAPRKWALAAILLAAGGLALPYLEAVVLKPGLEERVKAIRKEEDRLGLIDREVEFLRYLKQNQPPYLEALQVLSTALPQGSRMDAITMNRQGELTVRGSLRTSQDVIDSRTRLVESGFFSTVVIQEQSPTPDRQKVNFRISAALKAARGPAAATTSSRTTNAP